MIEDPQIILQKLHENHKLYRFTRDNYSFEYFLVDNEKNSVRVKGQLVRSMAWKGQLKLVYLKDHNKNEYVLKEAL